jgi:hypothetical protein
VEGRRAAQQFNGRAKDSPDLSNGEKLRAPVEPKVRPINGLTALTAGTGTQELHGLRMDGRHNVALCGEMDLGRGVSDQRRDDMVVILVRTRLMGGTRKGGHKGPESPTGQLMERRAHERFRGEGDEGGASVSKRPLHPTASGCERISY